jgi:hypothetical protein
MGKNKYSTVPPNIKIDDLIEDKKIKEFVLGAEPEMVESLRPIITSENKTAEKEPFPWEHPNVRSDVYKTFNLRLPEEYYLKLDYISKITNISKQKLCIDVVLEEIDKRLTIK